MNKVWGFLLISVLCFSCTDKKSFDTDTALKYCVNQVDSSLKVLNTPDVVPRNILNDATSKEWSCLLHSTGHKPHGYEIDASIIYADYYYIEALLRLKKINEGKALFE